MKFLRKKDGKGEKQLSGEGQDAGFPSEGPKAGLAKEKRKRVKRDSVSIVPMKSWAAFGFLLVIALTLVGQAFYVSRVGEFDTLGLENELAKLRNEVNSKAQALSSVSQQHPDLSRIELAQIQEKVPQASDLVVWDRRTLDSRYESLALAKASGFARLSAAERLMEQADNGGNAISSARFYRPALGQDTFMVLSHRHQGQVIQVLSPADEIIGKFKALVPEGMPAVLLQNGNAVANAFSGESLDLSSYEVSMVGPAEMSLAFMPPPAPSYWLGAPVLQLLLAGVIVLCALGMIYIPYRDHRRSLAPPPAPSNDEASRPTTSTRIAPVVAMPSGGGNEKQQDQDKSQGNMQEVEGIQAQPSTLSGPGIAPGWFIGSGLAFANTDDSPLPDSSQVRALVRALAEQAFGETAQGKMVMVVSDGREVSESISRWACEGLSSSGCSVLACPSLPLSVLPTLEKLRPSSEEDLPISLWIGSSSDDPNHTGMMVFEEGRAWSADDYSRWRLRAEERRFSNPASSEGPQALLDLDGMIPALVEKMSSSMQVEAPIRVVIDFGNGPLGVLAPEPLEAVGIEVVPLHAEMDDQFPNRQARVPSGWSSLATTVRQFRASFGVGISLDGTGLVVFDEKGQPVAPHRIFALLASDALIMAPGAKVEFDPRGMGEDTLVAIQQAGGIPVPVEGLDVFSQMSPSVPVAAKASGEFGFYRVVEDDGIPDALHVVSRLAVHLTSEGVSLSERLAALFDQQHD